MSDLVVTEGGILLPSSTAEKIEADKRIAKWDKAGHHPNGSFTMCPEAYEVLRDIFRNQGGHGGIQLPPQIQDDRITKLRQIIWERQGIDFETYN